jgi:hypothetical protein
LAKASDPTKRLIVKPILLQQAHAIEGRPRDAEWQTADLLSDGRPGCIKSAVTTMIVVPILYAAFHRISPGWSTLSRPPELGQFVAATSGRRRHCNIGGPSMRPSPLREFEKLDAAGGFVLLGAAVVALIPANRPGLVL